MYSVIRSPEELIRGLCDVISAVSIVAIAMLAPCSDATDAGSTEGLTKLKFSAPKLNEEESFSRFLPDHLKCDACWAVAYQMFDKFDDFNRIHKHYKFKLPESETIDLVEKACHSDNFQGYGIKTVDDVNRLTGPGLKTKDQPGMVSGGGKWPGRLVEICHSMVESLGEDRVYEFYRKNPKKRKNLIDSLCYGSGETGACMNSQNKKKQEL